MFVRLTSIFEIVTLIISNFVKTQQQRNIIHTTTTLSQAPSDLASTSSGELVFFAGGYNSIGASDRVDIYNVTSGSWTTATLSIPRYQLAATSSQNLAFFGGGSNGKTDSNRVDIYNTLNGSWSTAALSQPRHALAATSVGNLVLFGGGESLGNPFKVVDLFNGTSNTWTSATLSQDRSWLAATSVDNRYALFAGGYNGLGSSNVVDIFDSLSGMWNTTTLSQARYYLATTSLGNLAFFGGGQTNGYQPSNVVDIFNSTSRTWSNTTLSQARYYLSASSIEEIVAFGGGTLDGSTYYSVVDMLNVTSNIWFTFTLSQPRYSLASTSSTNKIFFGGGYGSSGYSNVVDIFEISLSSATTQLPSSSISPVPTTSTLPTIVPSLPIPSPISTSVSTSLPTTFPQSEPGSSPPVASSPSNNSISSDNNNDLQSGVIAGIVVGILGMFIGVGIVVLFVLLRRRRRTKKEIQNTPTEQPSNQQIQEKNSTQDQEIPLQPISKKHSQISFSEIVVGNKIGTGSYGKVCLGKWNNAVIALKFCKQKENIEDFMKEARIMINLPPHPNVVQMYGVSLDGPQAVLILEYCSGGSLDKLLFDSRLKLRDERKIDLVRGIAAGMLHLHKHNIVHRDLAARNILLTSGGDPKISDFGMSRLLEERDEGKTKSNIGPIRWMAPESLAQQTYSKQSDVWSFGIVVWEIVAQSEPHVTVNPVEVGILIRDKYLTPEIPSYCPQILRQIMEMCWQKDPSQRPNFEMICKILEQQ